MQVPSQEITIAGRPLKTREAIIAKLVREKSRLNRIQDIAGARVVVPNLDTQEAVLQLVLTEFSDSNAVVAKDTRETSDELGYRGLHVVVELNGRFAEIQIRTALQGLWAQVVEKLDETGGTDLKHGSGPSQTLEWLKDFSERLNRVEHGEKADMGTAAASLVAIALVSIRKKEP
jgi:ppGpp synthetase/RelA/SpoT-type nucleotidyltranferase